MANIIVNNLVFTHAGSYLPVFEGVSVVLDTDWKLGFIGRNGRGKTTFLRLLAGDFPYQGAISAPVKFAYFPFDVPDPTRTALAVAREAIAPFDTWEGEMEAALGQGRMDDYAQIYEQYFQADGYTIDEQIAKETGKLGIVPEALNRPFNTLSMGERTKLLLAALFLRKDTFLLIDEPTNHLDVGGRHTMATYLNSKKGFILVSHDRTFLDEAIDHVLSLNRSSIQVMQGNFTTWETERNLRDQFELDENTRLKREIKRLTETAREKAAWSDSIERGKIGQGIFDRGHVGHQAAKMMKRSKVIEQHVQRAIEEKQQLLQDLEQADPVKLVPLAYFKPTLLSLEEVAIAYGGRQVCGGVTFSLQRGDRLALAGPNGSGKSSLLKLILGEDIPHSGQVSRGTRLKISYVSQDTSHLDGDLRAYIEANGLDETLVKALLRQLDFSREQFEVPLARYSAGQKKKLLIAASLSTSAHLYIWDEPLNYIDVLTRMQIEALILRFQPTLLFVEHDRLFTQRVSTGQVNLGNNAQP